jgi:hypothetical protein
MFIPNSSLLRPDIIGTAAGKDFGFQVRKTEHGNRNLLFLNSDFELFFRNTPACRQAGNREYGIWDSNATISVARCLYKYSIT